MFKTLMSGVSMPFCMDEAGGEGGGAGGGSSDGGQAAGGSVDTGAGGDAGGSRSALLDAGSSTSDGSFSVPDDYREAKWAQNIKSPEDMWKQMGDMQGLIGKKFAPPAADASDEDKAAFYDQIRPESADKYELSLPDGAEFDLPDDLKAGYQGMFHKYGLSQEQANGLYQEAIALEASNQPSEADLDADFDKRMNGEFGEKTNDVLKMSARAMSSLSSDEKAALKSMPNEQFISVIKLLNNNIKGNEEGMHEGGDAGYGSDKKSIEDTRKELAALRSSKATKDPTHPDFEKNKKEIDRLTGIVNTHYGS